MDSSSAVLIIKALDCLSTRQLVTAQNIANANTVGYRPLKVTFEDALKQAALLNNAAVNQVTPKVERTIAGTPEGELRLDLEMATASGTAGRYTDLLEMLSRQIQLTGLAITGNV